MYLNASIESSSKCTTNYTGRKTGSEACYSIVNLNQLTFTILTTAYFVYNPGTEGQLKLPVYLSTSYIVLSNMMGNTC